MTVKIWRDHASHPYAVVANGRLIKVGKEARRQSVERLMRRLHFASGVSAGRKASVSASTSDDPASRRMAVLPPATRSPLLSGLFV
ncbi:MAG: hypothetical protein RMM58_14600 [Chloroflexota bacterium]|nr:hypothetical protein [Dehalococcoidia bacterium]MDW8255103.1 hypothetical protein [Chloroflexota bacterium]